MPQSFTCAECGKQCEYDDDWTEEQRLAELRKNFGPSWTPEDCVVICDECYKKYIPN